MKLTLVLILLFSAQILPVQDLAAQKRHKTWGVGVEVSGGYGSVADDGFQDLNPESNYVVVAYGFWMKFIAATC